MAKLKVTLSDEYLKKLQRLGDRTAGIEKKAIYRAAKVVTDKIRSNLESLPEDSYRQLQDGEIFQGVPRGQKDDLEKALGVTPIKQNGNGYDCKIGFDGYGSKPTKKYPQGLPMPMLARAVESGSSVRQKTPFVRPAVNASKKQAEQIMEETIDDEIKKIMK